MFLVLPDPHRRGPPFYFLLLLTDEGRYTPEISGLLSLFLIRIDLAVLSISSYVIVLKSAGSKLYRAVLLKGRLNYGIREDV